jgi:iron complex transport system substrate-binding protein
METKKGSFGKSFLSKRFVVIAIVLCSALLVALPAIAAEDDFVLDIYGNANEDDTIDMRDLTYVKLIFFGEKPETKLADAKYDGEINPLDFVQIKLVIVGKEKELTLVDSADRIVTVKKPLEVKMKYSILSSRIIPM